MISLRPCPTWEMMIVILDDNLAFHVVQDFVNANNGRDDRNH